MVAGDDRRFGDGLTEIARHDYHNKHQLICVAPEFTALPWYADHDQDLSRRDERHLLKAVIPLVESEYPVGRESNSRLLMGFSKSGRGASSLLLRHPTLFHRAVGFDPGDRIDVGPINDKERNKRIDRIFGSRTNLECYRLSTLITQHQGRLGDQPHLFYFNTQGPRALGGVRLHQLMIDQRLPHHYWFEPNRPRRWDSDWILSAVEFLVDSSSGQ